jgi:predicted nucleic acid-binding protein
MKGYLLDTNVISEYSGLRPPDPHVREWIKAQKPQSLYLSALTLGEIRKGATVLAYGNRRSQLESWLATALPVQFEARVLPVDGVIAEIWGAISGQAQTGGVALPTVDGLLAATAMHHNLAVVTRNLRHFTRWGIPVTNPWEPS